MSESKIRQYTQELCCQHADVELAIRLATVEPYNAGREYNRLSRIREMLRAPGADYLSPVGPFAGRLATIELAMQLLALQAYDQLVEALKAPEPQTGDTLTCWLERYQDHRKQVPASAATVSQEIRAAVEKLTGNKPSCKEYDLMQSVYDELTADFIEQVWEAQK